MKLSQLRHITEAAERGSLRAAARHLGIAQPAITRSIREVEHELGVPLFERRPRGVVLTEMGRVFVRRAEAIQNELRLATDEISQLRGNATGQVNISLSSAAQMALLPRVIEPFRKRFPQVHVSIMEGTFQIAEPALIEGEIDFYIGPLYEPPVGGELVAEKLFDNIRLVFGRKGHPKAEAQNLKDLQDARWIRTLVAASQSVEIADVFKEHGLDPPLIEMTVRSTIAIILAVANSDLLIMLPKQWLEFAGVRETMEPIPIKETLAAAPVCIVSRARLPLTPAAEFMADLFRRATATYLWDQKEENRRQ